MRTSWLTVLAALLAGPATAAAQQATPVFDAQALQADG
jgi:hypothetical protein